MENNSNSTQAPITQPVAPIVANTPLPPPLPKKMRFFDKLLLTLLILGIISGTAFYFLNKANLITDDNGLTQSPTPAPLTYTPPSEPVNSLLYLRDPDVNKADDLEAWLITPAGQEEKLTLPPFREAYKHYGDSRIFYLPTSNHGEIVVKDLITGVETEHIPVVHPDPSARSSLSLQNIKNISPDGKYLVFYVDFFKPCPSPSPFPSGFEGGWGPCMPDENLATPSGYYLYDIAKKTATYLKSSNLTRVGRWDTDKQELYYVVYGTANQTFKLALDTLASNPVDLTSHFGYYAYPLLNDGSYLKLESASSPVAFGKVTIFKDGKTVKTLAEVNSWAVLQPFLISSPDERYLIWQYTKNINGMHHDSLYYYDQETQKTGKLTPDSNDDSFNTYVSWLDDHTLVVAGDPIEETNFNGNNKYLLQIDLSTGKSTKITPADNVTYFNTQ